MKSLCLIALESNANVPDLVVREYGWEVESLIMLCEVLLVWNHSTSRQGCVYAVKSVKSKGIKSTILLSFLVRSSKFQWSFFEHLTAKTRQTIGRVNFLFEQISHSQTVAYSWRLILLDIFSKTQNVILRMLL